MNIPVRRPTPAAVFLARSPAKTWSDAMGRLFIVLSPCLNTGGSGAAFRAVFRGGHDATTMIGFASLAAPPAQAAHFSSRDAFPRVDSSSASSFRIILR